MLILNVKCQPQCSQNMSNRGSLWIEHMPHRFSLQNAYMHVFTIKTTFWNQICHHCLEDSLKLYNLYVHMFFLYFFHIIVTKSFHMKALGSWSRNWWSFEILLKENFENFEKKGIYCKRHSLPVSKFNFKRQEALGLLITKLEVFWHFHKT